MMNFENFKKQLTELTNYYDVPLSDFVVTGLNAHLLNQLYSSKNETSEIFTNNVALFATTKTADKLRKHFTTNCSKKAIITLKLDKTNVVVFEQETSLPIKIYSNVKFLNSKSLAEFNRACPSKFKEY